MKKLTNLFVCFMVVCLLAAMVPAIHVSAAEGDSAFVPSAYQEGISISDKCGSMVIDGEKISMEDLAAHDLQLVFSVFNSDESLQEVPESYQQLLKDAYDTLNKVESFGDLKLVAGSKSIEDALKDAGQENMDSLMACVVVVAITKLDNKDDVVDCSELEFKALVDYASQVVLVLHYLESGEWEVVDFTITANDEENSVTINGNGNGVYVLLVSSDVSGENRLNLFN